MIGTRQFSLGYLLLEIFWIALALGLVRYIVVNWSPDALMTDGETVSMLASWIAAILVIPAAIGGLFWQNASWSELWMFVVMGFHSLDPLAAG